MWMPVENWLLVIQKGLNHASHAATLVYAQMAQEPVQNPLEPHGEQLMRVTTGEMAEVVSLDG
jgi:hypothetical protein